MLNMRAIKKRVVSFRIAQRNKKHPFEFGNVRRRYRTAAAAQIEKAGQGALLSATSVLNKGLKIDGVQLLESGSLERAFRTVQQFFESHAVENQLKPWTVLGFMSDSFTPNGRVGVLCPADDLDRERVQYINITAGTFLRALYSAYHLLSDKAFEHTLPSPGQFTKAQADEAIGLANPIHVPNAIERRDRAVKFAVTALQAIFFHELAHILRGHAIYVKFGIATADGVLIEPKPKSPGSIQSADKTPIALETDADDFSGRFMAKAFFREFAPDELTFSNPQFCAKAFEVLVGVVLTYSLFEKNAQYHSGSLRAYILLGSMFGELGLDTKDSARWTFVRVDALQQLMIDNNLLDASANALNADEALALAKDTLAYRDAKMLDWLRHMHPTLQPKEPGATATSTAQ